MKLVYITLTALLFLAIAWYYTFYTKQPSKNVIISIGNINITAEIAQTNLARTRGLMGRKELGENNGMWFVFNKDEQHSFWMFNTFIPLDIIWVDKDFKIVHIEQNVPPCTESVVSACKSYKPDSKAKYVLEVNAGFVEKHTVQVGNIITL